MKETRFSKWKSYRNDILENNNIDESIANGDENIKKIINQIKSFDSDFSIAKINKQNLQKENNNRDSYKQKKEDNEANLFIDKILKNENYKIVNKHNVKEYNSHKYDDIINKSFSQFLPVEETTEITIHRKIDLKKIKE